MTASPLQAALDAAAAAGDVLRRRLRQTRQVERKGWRDIVTDADFAAERAALEILSARFPDYAVLSEEGQHGADLSAPVPIWVIDPLDGTTNYAHQFPSFSTAIALVHRHEIQVGVIHDPLRREAFFAERGRGAFGQVGRGRPQRLRASGVADMAEALVGVDWPRDPQARRRAMEACARVSAECRSVRTTGSAALGLAYLAAGRLEGYYHLSPQPWDVAAGALLVEEAGGRLSTPHGGAWRPSLKEIVASNGRLHEALLRALALA